MINENSASFDVGLLCDELVERLAASVENDKGQPLAVGHAAGMTDPSRGVEIVDAAKWQELSDRCQQPMLDQGDMTWRLHALTPTFWRAGNVDLLEPRAGSIIRGLARKWEQFSPLPLKNPAPRVAIRSSSIKYSSMSWRRNSRRGFVGHLDLSLEDPDPHRASQIDVLLSLADFCGLGSMTPFGFGVAALERKHQSSRPQPKQAQPT